MAYKPQMAQVVCVAHGILGREQKVEQQFREGECASFLCGMCSKKLASICLINFSLKGTLVTTTFYVVLLVFWGSDSLAYLKYCFDHQKP